jgi:hypothetical protein
MSAKRKKLTRSWSSSILSIGLSALHEKRAPGGRLYLHGTVCPGKCTTAKRITIMTEEKSAKLVHRRRNAFHQLS